MNAAPFRTWSSQESLLNASARTNVLWRLHRTSLASHSHTSSPTPSHLKGLSNRDHADSSSGMPTERIQASSFNSPQSRQRPAVRAFPPRKQLQSIDLVGERAIANGSSLLSSIPTRSFSTARTSLAIGVLKLQREMDSGRHVAGGEYEHIIQVANNEPWKHMWGLYQMLESCSIRLSTDTYLAVMFAAVKAGFVSDAVDVFHQLAAAHGPPSQRVYVTLISRLLHVKRRGVPNLSLALQLWNELFSSGAQLDAASYRAGINAHVESGRLKGAMDLIEAMSAAGMRPGRESFNMLIKGYAALGDMESARQVLPLMRKYKTKPDAYTFNTLLSGFSDAGDLDMAREVMAKALRDGCPPDVHTFTTLIQAYSTARLLSEAETILTEEMPAAGIKPNQHTFGILINGYLRTADVEGASRQVAAMAVAGVEMNLTLYNMILKGYCRAGDEAGSARTMSDMLAAGFVPGTDTYSTIIQAAIRAGDEQLAFKRFSDMKEAGCVIDAAVYTMMMGLYKMRMYETRAIEAALGGESSSYSIPFSQPESPPISQPAASSAHPTPALVPAIPDLLSNAASSHRDVHHSNGNGNGSLNGNGNGNGSYNGNGNGASNGNSNGFNSSASSSSSLPTESSSERIAPDSPPIRSIPEPPTRGSGSEPSSAAAAAAAHGPESYRRAIATFQAMTASPLVYVDVEAWSALVDVHVVGGDMAAAQEAASSAASLAASLSQRPPVHAFNALINGYVRLRQLSPALDAFRQFLTLGGVPPRKMCDRVIKLAFFLGDFTAANKAMRAMQLVGVEVDAIRYEEWLQQCQRKVNQRNQQQRSGGDQVVSDKGFERLKWWLGLPNNYYAQE